MADLTLDLQLIEQLKSDLSAVAKEFKDADDFSDGVADATGHESLHDHVRDFAHNWNDKRKSMTEDVEALQQQVQAIADGFKDVDEAFRKALEDGAKETAANHPGAVPATKN
jgi:uncharacterized protein YukE